MVLSKMETSIHFGNIRFRPLTKIKIVITLVLQHGLDHGRMPKSSEEEYFVEGSTMQMLMH